MMTRSLSLRSISLATQASRVSSSCGLQEVPNATRATHIGESGSVKLSLKENFKFRYTHMNICIYSIPHISRYFIRCSRSVGCNLENQLLGGKISKLDEFPVYWFPVFIMGTCVVFCPTHSLRKLAVSSLISTYASRF